MQNPTLTILAVTIAAILLLGCELDSELPTETDHSVPHTSSELYVKSAVASSGPIITVTTTSDAVDFGGAQRTGDLPGPDGLVSLREAILAANHTNGPQEVRFAIPVTDVGFDGSVYKIKPQGFPLPSIVDDSTTIDGSSQALYTGDTNPFGPEIVLDGTDAGFGDGIRIHSASHNTVRGLVSHSFARSGFSIVWGTDPQNNRITRCYSGTDATGILALGNGWSGIDVMGKGNTIGGTGPGEGNLVSGNDRLGIGVEGSENRIVGNLIGTDRTGTVALGNKGFGVLVLEGSNNVVGGSAEGAGNVVSGNVDAGVVTAGNGHRIENNLIGSDITGNNPLPNSTGVSIAEESADNVVVGNQIAFNFGTGVAVTQTARNNTISRNAIFSNERLGIDLGVPYHGDGVTPNDPFDLDSGPNDFQNYPVLTFAVAAPGQLIVRGTLDTPDPETVTLEFFANPVPSPGADPSGCGEGAVFLGTERPNKRGAFTAILPAVTPGTWITGTATDVRGNTSEFAANIEVTLPPNR